MSFHSLNHYSIIIHTDSITNSHVFYFYLFADACVAFVVTAVMYAEEILNRGSSTLGSVQELLDYVVRYELPTRRLIVPRGSYTSSFSLTFDFILNHHLSPDYIYPWFGETTYESIDCDWDYTTRYVELKPLNSAWGVL